MLAKIRKLQNILDYKKRKEVSNMKSVKKTVGFILVIACLLTISGFSSMASSNTESASGKEYSDSRDEPALQENSHESGE